MSACEYPAAAVLRTGPSALSGLTPLRVQSTLVLRGGNRMTIEEPKAGNRRKRPSAPTTPDPVEIAMEIAASGQTPAAWPST